MDRPVPPPCIQSWDFPADNDSMTREDQGKYKCLCQVKKIYLTRTSVLFASHATGTPLSGQEQTEPAGQEYPKKIQHSLYMPNNLWAFHSGLQREQHFNWNSSIRCCVPYNAPIFDCVQKGLVEQTRDLLRSGGASVWDVDPFDLGLLYVTPTLIRVFRAFSDADITHSTRPIIAGKAREQPLHWRCAAFWSTRVCPKLGRMIFRSKIWHRDSHL